MFLTFSYHSNIYLYFFFFFILNTRCPLTVIKTEQKPPRRTVFDVRYVFYIIQRPSLAYVRTQNIERLKYIQIGNTRIKRKVKRVRVCCGFHNVKVRIFRIYIFNLAAKMKTINPQKTPPIPVVSETCWYRANDIRPNATRYRLLRKWFPNLPPPPPDPFKNINVLEVRRLFY